MPTFRLKNLTVTLGEANLTPQRLCPFPTNFCAFPTDICNWHTPICNFPTVITCWTLSGCRWITPQTCWTPSPWTCWTLSPDPCGALSPVCNLSRTPTIIETVKETTPIILEASDAELEALRADLDTLIKTTKERGVEAGQAGQPQTREQVEMLEKELRAALEEVAAMKKNM